MRTKKQIIKIESKPINIWMIITIVLIVLVSLLSAMIISRMSYSAGYEDGQQGIIKMLQTQYQTEKQITNMNTSEMNQEVKSFVYFLNDMKINSYENKSKEVK